jgi:hypothetical protein
MDVVGDLIPADGHHIGIKTFSHAEAVFLQGVALPFGQGLNYFTGPAGLENIEGYGTLDAVEVIVEAGCGIDKEGSGDALQIQALCQKVLEKVLDDFDGDLRIVEIEIGLIVLGNVKVFHDVLSASWWRTERNLGIEFCEDLPIDADSD